jgi:hypothetical protein
MLNMCSDGNYDIQGIYELITNVLQGFLLN